MQSIKLEIIVFLCGATVMVYELVGSRVLAPHLGTSTYIWTSLIGVILGSLSIGYWSGGRIADKKPDYEILAGLIFLAAVIVGITTYANKLLLDIVIMKIPDIRLASVLASILLFAPASILLGMVSPFAVKLKSGTIATLGSSVGNLYAISTIGSIIGTFLAGFYLIPQYGTKNILILIALTLTGVAVITLPGKRILVKVFMIIYCLMILGGGYSLDKQYSVGRPLADIDTEYSRVQIFDEMYRKYMTDKGVPVRIMRLSNIINSAIFHNSDDLFLEYTRFFRLARHFRPDARNSLMIGGGVFVYPQDFLKSFPHATMDVVEIDQRLTELARLYFKFRASPRLQVINEDGRTFLNRSRNRYDLVFCDAFASVHSIPYQLTTLESVEQIHRILGDNGVALVNIISSIDGDKGRFLRAEYATFRRIFPHVYLFPVNNADDAMLFQNIMLVAIKGSHAPVLVSNDTELNDYLGHLWKKDVPSDIPVLTDDYAPVEHYMGIHS